MFTYDPFIVGYKNDNDDKLLLFKVNDINEKH